MAWRRCAMCCFYRNLEEDVSPFHSAFVDPIEMALVRVTPRGSNEIALVRRIVAEIPQGYFEENFVPATAARLEAWARRVADGARGDRPGWRQSILSDLDIDVYERDELLDSIEVLIELAPTPVRVETVRVPRDPEALWRAIFDMGVGVC